MPSTFDMSLPFYYNFSNKQYNWNFEVNKYVNTQELKKNLSRRIKMSKNRFHLVKKRNLINGTIRLTPCLSSCEIASRLTFNISWLLYSVMNWQIINKCQLAGLNQVPLLATFPLNFHQNPFVLPGRKWSFAYNTGNVLRAALLYIFHKYLHPLIKVS